MRRPYMSIVARLAFWTIFTAAAGAAVYAQTSDRRFATGRPPIPMRPSALAATVSELAGYPVTVPRARIVWVVDQHAVVVESDSIFAPRWRERGRVLVLVPRDRSLAIPRPPISIAPVIIDGEARTLLGVQAAHDVPWPEALTRHEVERMDIRAAILASSVRTPEGVELTSSAP